MHTAPMVHDELHVLSALVNLPHTKLIELGCGSARLAASLVTRFEGSSMLGLEVDTRQLAKNLAAPATPGLTFLNAGAQAIPRETAAFDGALMLKSLHHIPLALMDQALAEVARVLKPGGWLYVSEPVYDGALNDVVRLYNDEGPVRAAAQAALDRALASGQWLEAATRRFDMPAHFSSFANFEQRMMQSTFADHQISASTRAAVQAQFEPHMTAQGAHFTRPMLVRLLQKNA